MMKTTKIRYLCALGLMLGVAVHWGCKKEIINDEVGPVIKIPCTTAINDDGCQNKIVFAGEKVSSVYLVSGGVDVFVFTPLSRNITNPASNPFSSDHFMLCNPAKIKGLNLKAAKNYADGEKHIFKVNLRESCKDNSYTLVAPFYYAEIVSIESIPTSN